FLFATPGIELRPRTTSGFSRLRIDAGAFGVARARSSGLIGARREGPLGMMTQARPVKRMLRAAVAVVTAGALAATSFPARAQDLPKGLPIIRDSEIEQLLREYTQPILRAAGLAQQNIHVVIINDRSFNAFVVDAKRIFVNAGALMQSQTPNQII